MTGKTVDKDGMIIRTIDDKQKFDTKNVLHKRKIKLFCRLCRGKNDDKDFIKRQKTDQIVTLPRFRGQSYKRNFWTYFLSVDLS